MLPDASRLTDYAKSRGMDWMWRYRKNGDRWEAEVDLHHRDGGCNARWVGRGDNPQAALDQAIDHAIYYWGATGATHRGISHETVGRHVQRDRP